MTNLCCRIEKSHQENRLILGTFLFEGKGDASQAQEFLRSQATRNKCGDRLVDLCVHYGFDGWLLNVETDLGDSKDLFVSFLQYVTAQMKERVGDYAQVHDT